MSSLIRTLLFLLAVSVFFPLQTKAQAINAKSCSESDVQSALSAAVSGSTVVIPAGTCSWSSPLTFNAPPNVTLEGQTVCSGSGNPSQQNLSCADNTVIVDSINRSASDPAVLAINTNSSGSFRLTGITFAWGNAGGVTYNGSVRFGGSSKQLRVDHIHFKFINALAFTHAGSLNGVFDHILLDGSTGSGWRDYGDTSTNGDSNWAAPTGLGSSNFLFFEDSTFNTASNDCQQGGSWVIRYSTFNNNGLQTHPTGGAGRARGCRAWEMYGNTFQNFTTNNFNVFFVSSGTGVIWGNTAAAGVSHFVTVHSMRRDNTTYTETATPNGWGYCGTSFDGAGSNWDQNTSTSTGHHCMDQPGQGQGDLLSGNFPNVINTATKCTVSQSCAWPRQASEPIYEWMDKWTVSGGGNSFWAVYEADAEIENADFYTSQDTTNGTTKNFDGTSGTGFGTLSSRPSTCTPQVAYWATDSQTLYKCTSANTWSSFYQPYTYPHPLQSGSQNSGEPAPPTGLTATVN